MPIRLREYGDNEGKNLLTRYEGDRGGYSVDDVGCWCFNRMYKFVLVSRGVCAQEGDSSDLGAGWAVGDY
jgi:hypothetical protein